MEKLLQQLEHENPIAPAAENRKLPRHPMPWIRIALATATGVLFLGLALTHTTPIVMFVGLAPLAVIAMEAVWRLFDTLDE